MTTKHEASPTRLDERRGLSDIATAGLVALALFALLLPRLHLPWGGGLADLCGGAFMLPEMRSFEAVGWGALRGIPHLGTLPTDPPSGTPYAHHPPGWPAMLFLFTRIAGTEPFGLRLLPAISAAATAGLLAYWLMRRGAPRAITTIVILSRPMFHLYGTMSNPESSTLLLISIGLFADELRREGRNGARGVLYFCTFVAPWLDWQGFFLPLAVLLRSLFERRGWQQWKLEFTTVAVAGMSALLLILWMGASIAHIHRTSEALWGAAPLHDTGASTFVIGIRYMSSLGNVSTFAPVEIGFVAWCSEILGHYGRLLAPCFSIAILPILAMSRCRLSILAVIALPGILNVSLFPFHAWGHEFWVFYLLPASIWLLTTSIVAVFGRGREGIVVAIMLAASGAATVSSEFEKCDASISLVEGGADGLRRVARPGVASIWTEPPMTATGYLKGHVTHLPVTQSLAALEFSRRGLLTAPIDVMVAGNEAARAESSKIPEDIKIVEIPLTESNDPSGALKKWARGAPSILRIEIPRFWQAPIGK